MQSATSTAPSADGERCDWLSTEKSTLRFEMHTANNFPLLKHHYCTVIDEAGHNTKKLFGITNALLSRSAPVPLLDSYDDSSLAKTFHQFFTEKIVNIHCTIDS